MNHKVLMMWSGLVYFTFSFFHQGWSAAEAGREPPVIDGQVVLSMRALPSDLFFEEYGDLIRKITVNEWCNKSARGLDLTCFQPLKDHLWRVPTYLRFPGQNLTARDAVLLCRALNLFPSLRGLDLSDNKIGLIGLGALGGGLRHTPLLEELKLRKVGAETVNVRGRLVPAPEDPSFGSLMSELPKLRVLDLSENKFSDAEAAGFLGYLEKASGLEELSLQNIEITSQGAATLLEGMTLKGIKIERSFFSRAT